MKKLFMAACAFFLCSAAEAQVQMPKASPTEFIRQEFGLGTIELTYSRPGVKGRQMIGVVEPWGNVWRTGANEATQITFSDTVLIDGKSVLPGTYAVYTVPHENGEWDFILNNGKNNWGAFAYDAGNDIVSMNVKAGRNNSKVETLTMQFSDIKPESLLLNIKWEDFSLQIPIQTAIKDRIRNAIAEAMKGEKKPYWQAATFYNEYDKDYAKALQNADAALAEMKEPPYYMIYYKAGIQKSARDKKGALETARQALEAAKKAKNDNFIVLSTQMVKELQ